MSFVVSAVRCRWRAGSADHAAGVGRLPASRSAVRRTDQRAGADLPDWRPSLGL